MIDVLKDDEATLFVIAKFSEVVDIINGTFKCDLDPFSRYLKSLWLVESDDKNDFIVEYNGTNYYLFVAGEIPNHKFVFDGEIFSDIAVYRDSFMRVNSKPQPLFVGRTKHYLDFIWIP